MLIFVFFGACTSPRTELEDSGHKSFAYVSSKDPSQLAHINRVFEDIMRVAADLCRETNPTAHSAHCEFQLRLMGSGDEHAFANLSNDATGGPIITISESMAAQLQNVDEAAFIMAHEAGHQIQNHIEELTSAYFLSQPKSDKEAKSGFALGKTNRKRLELEADVIATILTHRSGYNPLRGALSIPRFTPKFAINSKTHPSPQERLQIVRSAFDKLSAGVTISIN